MTINVPYLPPLTPEHEVAGLVPMCIDDGTEYTLPCAVPARREDESLEEWSVRMGVFLSLFARVIYKRAQNSQPLKE